MDNPYLEYIGLSNLDKSSYKTNHDIQLDTIADDDEWIPSIYITDLVRNFKDIKVELITRETIKETTFKEINNDLRNPDNLVVGLIVLGNNLLHEKAYLILLTTISKIYAFDPYFDKGITFLKMKLDDIRIEYWLSNTIEETSYFLNKLDVDLSDKKHVKSCEAVHVHIMETIKRLPEPARHLYSPQARLEARKHIRLLEFEKLVEIYLDINKEDVFYDKNKLPHLSSRPLNLTALNIIKKRCILVRDVAKSLSDVNQMELRAMHKIVYGRLLRCTSEQVRNIVESEMKKCKEGKDLVDTEYFVHLSAGFNFVQDSDSE